MEKPQPFRGSAPFLKTVPPLSLPLRHFAFAAAAFLTFASALTFGADRLVDFGFGAFWALGLTHTLTLGWVAMTILGALCQMIPAHGQTPLRFPRAVAAAWWLLAVGVAGFVGALWAGSTLYWIPAAVAAAAILIYLACLGATLARSAPLDWSGVHLATGLAYLALLAVLGVLLAYDRERGLLFRDPGGALIAHVHLALVGWVSLTIFGASYRLAAPVGQAHLASPVAGRLAYGLVNLGLLGLAADGLWFGHRRLAVWGGLIAAGYACYAWQARGLFKPGLRDPAAGFVRLALLGGAAWCALGLALATGRLPDGVAQREAYVWVALLGWSTPWILGQAHKIAPFLVWLHVYSPREWVPPVKVPKIEDLTSRGLARAELVLLACAVPAGAAGFLREDAGLVRAGGALLLGCAAVFAVSTIGTLRHLARRDPRWSVPGERPDQGGGK